MIKWEMNNRRRNMKEMRKIKMMIMWMERGSTRIERRGVNLPIRRG